MTPTAFELLILPSCLAVVAGLAMGSFATTLIKTVGIAVLPATPAPGGRRPGR